MVHSKQLLQVYQSKLDNRSLRRTLLLGAASAVVLGLSTPASAQVDCKAHPNDPSCQSGSLETVIVTGSRIPQQGLNSRSPVTSVDQQEAQMQGTTNIDTLLNNLPSVFADQTEGASNNSSAAAILYSRQNPKILWVDDAEIVGDRIAELGPVFWDFFA